MLITHQDTANGKMSLNRYPRATTEQNVFFFKKEETPLSVLDLPEDLVHDNSMHGNPTATLHIDLLELTQPRREP